MGWVILLLVLLAAAFGVLGAVVKVAAFLVLTILLTVTALVAVAWYSFKGQLRRWERNGVGGGLAGPHVDLGSATAATAGSPRPTTTATGASDLSAGAKAAAPADARTPGTTR